MKRPIATMLVSAMLFSVFSLTPIVANAQNQNQASITLVKQWYSNQEFDYPFASIDGYVFYDISVRNVCCEPLENQKLWVHFTSTKTGSSNSFAVFTIQNLEVGQSQLLHLGPFKILETGYHNLYMGLNPEGSKDLENSVSIYNGNTGSWIDRQTPLTITPAYDPSLNSEDRRNVFLLLAAASSVLFVILVVKIWSNPKKERGQEIKE